VNAQTEEQRKLAEEQRKRDEKLFSYLEESKTECKNMSKASEHFTSSLLRGLGISWEHAPSNDMQGVECTFSWEKGEEKETGKAIEYLKELLQEVEVTVKGGATMGVEILDVHSLLLNPIKGNHKEAAGKTDALIRVCQPIMDDTARFAWALCIVEFKTDKEQLKFPQQLLELVSVSNMSDYRQGTVLLGTDLNKKWEIMHFEKPNHIVCQVYKFGSVAISELRKLLMTASVRLEENKGVNLPYVQSSQLLPVVHQGEEQDLVGFDIAHDPQADARQFLQDFARQLNYVFNQEVILPSWVNEVPPGMYM
jgi:hypothetical protein